MNNEIGDFEEDELVLAELKAGKFDGLSLRCKAAIKEIAEFGLGSVIFLFLSYNKRIRILEEKIASLEDRTLN